MSRPFDYLVVGAGFAGSVTAERLASYYPIPRPDNAELYRQYRDQAVSARRVHFVGRLATYRYYNMDQVVAQALTLFGRIASGRRGEQPAPLAAAG